MLLRLVVWYVRIAIVLLMVLILCNQIAGPKNAPFWFSLISLTLLALTITGLILRRSR